MDDLDDLDSLVDFEAELFEDQGAIYNYSTSFQILLTVANFSITDNIQQAQKSATWQI